jgi:cold shock CspA family protein
MTVAEIATTSIDASAAGKRDTAPAETDTSRPDAGRPDATGGVTPSGRRRSSRGPRAEQRDSRADGFGPAPRGRQRTVAGTVTRYDPQRGFGFIARRGKPDVFVHASALASGHVPQSGERVRFEVAPGRRGQQARNVRRVA